MSDSRNTNSNDDEDWSDEEELQQGKDAMKDGLRSQLSAEDLDEEARQEVDQDDSWDDEVDLDAQADVVANMRSQLAEDEDESWDNDEDQAAALAEVQTKMKQQLASNKDEVSEEQQEERKAVFSSDMMRKTVGMYEKLKEIFTDPLSDQSMLTSIGGDSLLVTAYQTSKADLIAEAVATLNSLGVKELEASPQVYQKTLERVFNALLDSKTDEKAGTKTFLYDKSKYLWSPELLVSLAEQTGARKDENIAKLTDLLRLRGYTVEAPRLANAEVASSAASSTKAAVTTKVHDPEAGMKQPLSRMKSAADLYQKVLDRQASLEASPSQLKTGLKSGGK